MKEVSINIKNLLYRILLKWRMILILGIVCALIGNCYGIYSDYKKVNAAKKAENAVALSATEKAKEEAERCEAKLSIREKKDVDAAIEIYSVYENRYEDLQNYIANSVLMQMDYKHVSSVTLKYFADDHVYYEYPVAYQKSYSAEIAEAYAANVLNEETVEKVAEICGISKEDAGELLSVESKDEFITVCFIGNDEEQCKQVAEILKDSVKGYNPSAIFKDFDINLIAENYATGVNEEVYEKQVGRINELTSVRTSRAALQGNMTDLQKTYFIAQMEYLDLLKSEDGSTGESNSETGEAPKEAAPKVSFFHSKNTGIGFLAGAMLGCLIVIFSYILTPVVRTKENITAGLKQTVLGTIWAQNGKKKFLGGIDRLITKWFYGRESAFATEKRIEMLCAGIRIAMEKEGVNKLYISGASEKGNEIMAGLKESLKDSLTVKSGDCIVYHSESLKDFSDSDAVAFVETVGDSRYEEILKEIELAGQSKVKVLGFVLVQN